MAKAKTTQRKLGSYTYRRKPEKYTKFIPETGILEEWDIQANDDWSCKETRNGELVNFSWSDIHWQHGLR